MTLERNTLTQKRLKELLSYDPLSGTFTRVKQINSRTPVGSRAGCKKSDGYISIKVDYVDYKAHRLAILFMDGYLPEDTVDHIDRDRGNNKYCNLREATQVCQVRNSGMLRNNTSGIKGVYWATSGRRWVATVNIQKKVSVLGRFKDKLDAAYARYAVEQCLGFTDCDSESSAKKFIDIARIYATAEEKRAYGVLEGNGRYQDIVLALSKDSK